MPIATTRLGRAVNEHMTLRVIGPNQFTVTGDSGVSHVIETDGVDALSCTCPDHKYNLSAGQKCKHMIAYEDWYVNDVEFGDQILD